MVKPLRICNAKHWCQKDISPRSSGVSVQTVQGSPEGTDAQSQLGKSERKGARQDARQAAGCAAAGESHHSHHLQLLSITLCTNTDAPQQQTI